MKIKIILLMTSLCIDIASASFRFDKYASTFTSKPSSKEEDKRSTIKSSSSQSKTIDRATTTSKNENKGVFDRLKSIMGIKSKQKQEPKDLATSLQKIEADLKKSRERAEVIQSDLYKAPPRSSVQRENISYMEGEFSKITALEHQKKSLLEALGRLPQKNEEKPWENLTLREKVDYQKYASANQDKYLGAEKAAKEYDAYLAYKRDWDELKFKSEISFKNFESWLESAKGEERRAERELIKNKMSSLAPIFTKEAEILDEKITALKINEDKNKNEIKKFEARKNLLEQRLDNLKKDTSKEYDIFVKDREPERIKLEKKVKLLEEEIKKLEKSDPGSNKLAITKESLSEIKKNLQAFEKQKSSLNYRREKLNLDIDEKISSAQDELKKIGPDKYELERKSMLKKIAQDMADQNKKMRDDYAALIKDMSIEEQRNAARPNQLTINNMIAQQVFDRASQATRNLENKYNTEQVRAKTKEFDQIKDAVERWTPKKINYLVDIRLLEDNGNKSEANAMRRKMEQEEAAVIMAIDRIQKSPAPVISEDQKAVASVLMKDAEEKMELPEIPKTPPASPGGLLKIDDEEYGGQQALERSGRQDVDWTEAVPEKIKAPAVTDLPKGLLPVE